MKKKSILCYKILYFSNHGPRKCRYMRCRRDNHYTDRYARGGQRQRTLKSGPGSDSSAPNVDEALHVVVLNDWRLVLTSTSAERCLCLLLASLAVATNSPAGHRHSLDHWNYQFLGKFAKKYI